eukprot:CAMPEP_0202913188 /NCGR_PEP_ID=MMETSP1392-20130828/59815_1 /ASSEMBLY_ACC=CAM_ASM_000868 /TAXON_ID=225041 /ORGANISM="Chlamydomonas chlamydogama, Strain SAG 11-48b" /LENGTH=136 /DNA_ID=CAMNT_0049604365 /DNA_START=121 /DNA_END=531 /DNA_ORIENTATION=+
MAQDTAPSSGAELQQLQEDDNGTDLGLPLTRVQKLIKSEESLLPMAKDATMMVAKATDLFLTELGRLSYKSTSSQQRKTIEYKDAAQAVKEWEACDFLADIVPQKVALATLLAQREKQAAVTAAESDAAGLTKDEA